MHVAQLGSLGTIHWPGQGQELEVMKRWGAPLIRQTNIERQTYNKKGGLILEGEKIP